MDVDAAAAALGISPNAVRKRLRRGTLTGRKEGDAWDVDLPDDAGHERAGGTGHEPGRHRRAAHGDEALLLQLQSENAWLRERLQAAEVERAEMRRLLGNQQQQLAGLLAAPATSAAAGEPVEGPEAQAAAQATGHGRHRGRWGRFVGRLRGRRPVVE